MTMTNTVLTDWDADKAKLWGKAPIVARHNVHEREMFTDAGLARLLDTYPREKLGIYTMGRSNADDRVFRRGKADDMPGADLLQAVANGRLWLNLRACNERVAEFGALSDELFGSLEAVNPGLRTFKRDVGVLISSPNAQVFYHLDIPMVALWQVRGVKRFHVYPVGEPFARDEQIESIILKETEEEISYQPIFDRDAQVIDLEPGMMATWPQNAPHRIENHNVLNVSLSCEFQTMDSVLKANAMYANGVLRRRWGHNPSIARDTGLRRYAKAGLARAMKAFMAGKGYERQTPVTFVVDPNVQGSVRDIAAA